MLASSLSLIPQSVLHGVVNGTVSGAVGGLLAYLLVDVGLKRPRERRNIASAIAAELRVFRAQLETAADARHGMEALLNYSTCPVVMPALASRLGELRVADLTRIVQLYAFVANGAKATAIWREQARAFQSAPPTEQDARTQAALDRDARNIRRVLSVQSDACEAFAAELGRAYAPYRARWARSRR